MTNETSSGRERVRLDSPQHTMLYTLYYRALDARSSAPLVGDPWAADVLRRVRTNRRLALTLHASDRWITLLRARQLDQWTREFLAARPDAVVVQLGCGLDSRAFRLDLPETVEWFDVDYPEVVELRRRFYPERPNYRTIASSIVEPGWVAELPDDRPALVIGEGVFPYLDGADVRRVVERLVERLPEGTLMFDGVAPWVCRTTRMMHWGFDDPAAVARWHDRLELVDYRAPLGEHDLIPAAGYRALYRAMARFEPLRVTMLLARYRF